MRGGCEGEILQPSWPDGFRMTAWWRGMVAARDGFAAVRRAGGLRDCLRAAWGAGLKAAATCAGRADRGDLKVGGSDAGNQWNAGRDSGFEEFLAAARWARRCEGLLLRTGRRRTAGRGFCLLTLDGD